MKGQREHLEFEGQNGSWSLLRTLTLCALIVVVALSAVRYEGKIADLERRIEMLEAEEEREALFEPQEKREKREASPYRRGEHMPTLQRNDAEETFFTRRRDGSYVRPSGLREIYERLPPLSSEEQPQEQWTTTQRPVVRQRTIETRTRSGDNYMRNLPPVQNVGPQVSARVVKYENEEKSVPMGAHFVADVSNYTNNNVSPRLRNQNGIFQLWKPAPWMKQNSGELFRQVEQDGMIQVKMGGIYHVYAQVTYDDAQDNSFIVEANGKPILQCSVTKGYNSCYTAGLTSLMTGDRLQVKNVGQDRFSIYSPEKSFFGFVKIQGN